MVVILIDSAREQSALKDDEGFIEFSEDFWHYTQRFVAALRAQPEIRVVTSSARQVRFSDKRVAPINRRRLEGGYGYVLYRPGAAPVVLAGVHVDDELVCAAARLYGIGFTGYDCPQ